MSEIDSGRFDMTRGEIARYVVAMVTAENVEEAARYHDETFANPTASDLLSALDSAGMIIGHMLQILWRCKSDPWAKTVLDAEIARLVEEGMMEEPGAPRGSELYDND